MHYITLDVFTNPYSALHSILHGRSIYSFDHDDVIKWKHFPRNWPFVRRIHRSPVNSPHKGQWRGALMFTLICVWINGWVNNREAGDLRRYRGHYDVIVMLKQIKSKPGSYAYVVWVCYIRLSVRLISDRCLLKWISCKMNAFDIYHRR